MKSTPKPIAPAAALLLAAGIVVASDAACAASRVVVGVDEIKRLAFGGEASAVFIANPAVAEAIVHNGTEAILHGRMPGTTDLLAHGADGEPLGLWRVTVTGPRHGDVVVYRGGARQTLYCGDVCIPGASIGDDPNSFNQISGQARSRSFQANDAGGARQEDIPVSVE